VPNRAVCRVLDRPRRARSLIRKCCATRAVSPQGGTPGFSTPS